MAVSFQSAQRRMIWGAMAFSLATEYVAAFVAYQYFSAGNGYVWLWALLTVAAIQAFLLLYGLFGLARRSLWYFLFEKEQRSNFLAQEFSRLKFPRPDAYYSGADDYLAQVALSPSVSRETALSAGLYLGALQAHRLNGPRSEAFFLALSIENAMQKMTPAWSPNAEGFVTGGSSRESADG